MAPLNLLAVVSASLLVVTRTTGALGGTASYAVTLGSQDKCLSDINDAREAAGLSEFGAAKSGSQLPAEGHPTSAGDVEYKKWVWYPVCEALLQKTTTVSTPTPSVGGTFSAGTYAYYVANSDTVDCKAVLKQWKDAYKNFEGLPPKYSAEAAVYQNPDNVSLVAMYNPLSGATADCRMVTCTKTVDSPSTTENGYGLMCMTSPDALQKASPKSPPFSQDQWDKIVSAIKGSASAASPSVVGFVAAILGFSIMML